MKVQLNENYLRQAYFSPPAFYYTTVIFISFSVTRNKMLVATGDQAPLEHNFEIKIYGILLPKVFRDHRLEQKKIEKCGGWGFMYGDK